MINGLSNYINIISIFNNIKLALCYFLAGLLVVHLALEPGLAIPLFPSAGIALGALVIWGNGLWFGVLLGSALFNLTLFLTSSILLKTDVLFICILSLASTLQAVLGAFLIRRFIRFPTELLKDRDIFKFLLLGGPTACFVGSTFIILSAFLLKLDYLPYVHYQWATWWAGGSFGVMIFTPVLLMLLAKNRTLWKQRQKLMSLPLIFMLSVIIILHYRVSDWANESNQFEFKEITSEHTKSLNNNFLTYIDSVASIERFFSSTNHVDITKEDFQKFVKYLLHNKKGINGVSWNPIVLDSDRETFEMAFHAIDVKPFFISELNDQGERVKANKRARYVPVKYIEPMEVNYKALGFDVSSNIVRRKALDKAMVSGAAQATAKISLVQDHTSEAGILLFYPVYSKTSKTPLERENNLLGFVVGVFRVGNITDSVLNQKVYQQAHLSIYDITDGIYTPLYGAVKTATFYQETFKVSEVIIIGGREWLIEFFPTEQYLKENKSWQVWLWFIAALFFISLLGAFLLSISARSHYLKNEVLARTTEIEINRKEIEKKNALLEERNKELELSNIDLDQYAFVASHDLKSPLQAIEQLASWIKEDNDSILPETSIEHINTLQQRIVRMKTMLADLLLYSRISREEFEDKEVHLNELIEQLIEFNNVQPNFIIDCINCEQIIHVKAFPLELAIRNLLSNAIVHHDKKAGCIIIKYSFNDNYHHLSISDDGPGIEQHLHGIATEMFNTLQPRDIIEGSGLGLSIVNKAISKLNGTMSIDSDGKNGSCFHLRWPA
jgi:CHASE1-domain containing sensor protein/two-component sensor histidine kinase